MVMLFRHCVPLAFQLTLVACLSGSATAKVWRGIIPLQSTRADVERLLGQPTLDKNVLGQPLLNETFYDTEDGRARIEYSTGHPCEEGVPGLGNIPKDTVTQISLYFKSFAPLSSILVSGKHYTRIRETDNPTVYYVDVEEGVSYTEQDGYVMGVSYSGAAADEKRFSCGEAKYAAPIPKDVDPDATRFEQYPLDRYGRIPFEDAQARLDNFVIQLFEMNKTKPEYRGFILVYAGSRAHENEAQLIVRCTKDYLVKVREAPEESIVAVDAGHREEFGVELYIYPIKAYPPRLLPTVSPRKVTTVKGAWEPCH